MGSSYDILLDIRARVDSLAGTVAELRGLKGAVGDAGVAARSTTESFLGLAKAQGVQIATDAVRRLVSALTEAVKEGVRFNAVMETANIGIAGLLRNADPNKFANYSAAVAASTKVLEQLKDAAKDSPASLSDLTEAFKSTAGAALAAGIPIERQVGLLVRLSQVLSALGIPSVQIPQELRALLTGDIDINARAANTLGITGDDVRRERQRGTLEQFLLQRTSGFGEAAQAASQSFEVLASNVGDALQQLKGVATNAITGELKNLLNDTLAILGKPELTQNVRTFSLVLAGLLDGALKAAKALSDLNRAANQTYPGQLAAGARRAVFGSSDEAARELNAAERAAALREQIAGAKTQQDFDEARLAIIKEINATPQGEGFRNQQVLLQAILGSYRSLSEVTRKRESEEARVAAATEAVVQRAKEVLATSTDTLEREKAYNQIVGARDAELARGANANQQRLAALTRIVAEEDKVRAGAIGTSNALKGLITDSRTIEENFRRIPEILRDMTDKLRDAKLQLALIRAGSNETAKLDLVGADARRAVGESRAAFERVGVRRKVDRLPPRPGVADDALPAPFTAEERLAELQRDVEETQKIYNNLRDKLATNPALGAKDAETGKSLIDVAKEKADEAIQALQRYATQEEQTSKQLRQQRIEDLKLEEEAAKKRQDFAAADAAARERARLEATESARSSGYANPEAQGARVAESQRQLSQAEANFVIREATLQQKLAGVDQERQRISEANFLTANEQEAANQRLLQRQIDILRELIALERERASALEGGSPEDQKSAQGLRERIQELEAQLGLAEQKQRGQGLGSRIFGDLQGGLAQFGSTSQQISGIFTGTLTTAISGVQSAIGGLVNGTLNWGQAFRQVGAQIVTTLISLIARFLILQALVLSLNFIGSFFGAPNLGTSLLKVASIGRKDGGEVVRAANGAYIGQGTTSTADDVFARLSRGEFVMREAAVRKYGLGRLYAMNSLSAPVSAFAVGGLAGAAAAAGAGLTGGSSAGSARGIKIVAALNMKALVAEALRDPDVDTHFLDLTRSNRVELGILG